MDWGEGRETWMSRQKKARDSRHLALIAANDSESAFLLKMILGETGRHCRIVSSFSRVIEEAHNLKPRLILVAKDGAAERALDICKLLGTDTELKDIPVIVLSDLSGLRYSKTSITNPQRGITRRRLDREGLRTRIKRALARTRKPIPAFHVIRDEE